MYKRGIRLAEKFCLANDNIHNEPHCVVKNIPIFLNTEFVCSVDNYQPPQWRGNNFWTERVAEPVNIILYVSFILPQIAKHLH